MATDRDTSPSVSAARATKNIAGAVAGTARNTVDTVIEAVKDFFNELVHPNMTIEKIAEVATPRLDEVIIKNEENGLKYTAGKFKIDYLDEDHFGLSFEMYFKDADGKWYKTGGSSDPRDVSLLELGAWKTLQTLKSVEFPISAPAKEAEAALEAKSNELQSNEPASKSNAATSEPTVEAVKTVVTVDSDLPEAGDKKNISLQK